MFKKTRLIFVFAILLDSSSFAKVDDSEACKDLAKATCEGPWVHEGNKAKESLLSTIKQSFESELKAKTKLTPEQVKEEVEAIHNRSIGKPSKYLDPNEARPQHLFDLYEGTAHRETQSALSNNQVKIERIRVLFEETQKALVEKIKNEVSEPKKSSMIERLESIKINNKLCSRDYKNAEYYLNGTAFYQTGRHEFGFCPSLLLGEVSEAQLVFLIGHELSHSIDPCVSGIDIGQASGRKMPPIVNYNTAESEEYNKRLENFPYSETLLCLRQEKSGAIETPVSPDGSKKVTNQFFYDNLCDHDQIIEVFCDWMGAEITPVVLKKLHSSMSPAVVRKQYSMALSTKCLARRHATDMHATLERRLNGIIGVNPQIRKAMRCDDEISLRNNYCKPPEHRINVKPTDASVKGDR